MDIAEALRHAKERVHTAAKYLGASPATVYNYLREDPELQEIRDHMYQLRGDIFETKLDQAAERGEAWAVCFALKTQYKDRGYIERVETTGANGGPIVTAD
jgi:predicted transcriptional regulator